MLLLLPLHLTSQEKKSFKRIVGKYIIEVAYQNSTGSWYYSIWSEREGKNKFIQYEHFNGFANSREKAIRKCNKWLVDRI